MLHEILEHYLQQVETALSTDDALLQINNELRERFEIGHTTVQFELGDTSHPCKQAPCRGCLKIKFGDI